ncbi:MAG: RNA polymerase factor sigma-32 [Bdellovibrionales bacterium]|nr:RNA polymerase factor sigma-32 [Bdellovibrionales bacterium]
MSRKENTKRGKARFKDAAHNAEPGEQSSSEELAEVEISPEETKFETDGVDFEILPAEDSGQETKRREPPVTVAKRRRSNDLVPYDALSAYLREIAQYPPLSRSEEHSLAVAYYKNKDREAAIRLIKSNLLLVVKIARDYERAARSLLDLVQEGNIGLMEAVKNFDPYRGVRFPSYAVWWIKAYIIRYVIANWRMVKIGTTQAQRKLFFNLQKEKEKLEREGFYAGPRLLAERLDVKESDVVEMEQRLGSPDMSVDAPISDDSESNILSVLPAEDASAEELLVRRQMQQLLKQNLDEFASTLNPKESLIFSQRMLSEEKATLQELSDKLSISKERVRQIENRIQEKLKQFLSERFGSGIGAEDFEASES